MSTSRTLAFCVRVGLLGLASLALVACGEEQQTAQRGLPPGTKRIDNSNKGGGSGGGTRRSGKPRGGEEEEEVEEERPDRPTPELTRETFSYRARDPFHNYLAAEAVQKIEPVVTVRPQRDVKMAEYGFEDLKLIAIVNAGRRVAPKALFLAGSDNKSKSVSQGEYFSSAELLLASVNRDYIEVEVVDPELTPWNLEKGERKVIYLKDR